MVEHLLIGDIASLLIVLGLTRLAAAADPLDPLFNRLQVLTHPLVALPLWALNFYFWHVPAIYDAAYGTAPMHALEHTTFLVFGCLMWMPIFGPLPKPEWFTAGWKVGYVIAVRFLSAILGNVLMWSGTVLYPIYGRGEHYWGISPIGDQSTAGAIMMIEGTFLALGVLAWIFLEVAREGSETPAPARARRRSAASPSTSGARSARSRPGHGARLEERIVGGEGDAVGRGPGWSPGRSAAVSPSESTSRSPSAPRAHAAAGVRVTAPWEPENVAPFL